MLYLQHDCKAGIISAQFKFDIKGVTYACFWSFERRKFNLFTKDSAEVSATGVI